MLADPGHKSRLIHIPEIRPHMSRRLSLPMIFLAVGLVNLALVYFSISGSHVMSVTFILQWIRMVLYFGKVVVATDSV